MEDEKQAGTEANPDDAPVGDEDRELDKATKQNPAHPGYSRWRKSRQFGG